MEKKKRIAFVGMGSIGRRHLHNVSRYFEERREGIQIDLYRSGLGAQLDEETTGLIDNIFMLDDATSGISVQYDALFITNPTSKHYDTLRRFANNARAIFIEKPVFDTTDTDLEALMIPEGTICYVACPLRYNPVVEYVRGSVDCSQAYCVRAICSSYLPEWRPGTDYRRCYSAHKAMGGGVSIDLIHEWDYLTCLFGFPLPGQLSNFIAKTSALEIDSDDAAAYIAYTGRSLIELHLDYYGRASIREFTIFMPDDTIVCDILHGTVKYLKNGKTLSFDSERNDYQMKEICHFFDIANGACPNDNTIENALKVLEIAKGIN